METKLLEETLVQQLQLFEELHALLEQETDELARMNLDAMEDVNRQKKDLAERVEAHNGSLRRMIAMIASEQGLASGVTLGSIAAAMGHKGDLVRLRHKLTVAAQRVQDTAAVNSTISERFARTASMTLGHLSRQINRSSVYGASGGYQQRSSVAVMINREA
ncbi:flagellar protein FlgN [Geobacter sp. FeAm09]|uniref:flagellar protein FlgN n=1 Tax=Geobacter sp. FeAm09 TaxID=2597769 RepID=UPI0011F02878|nr:flagellar protein FlgN [Geobacter sp. FeAm09]QEM68023.1 flagellar protein FlgN [Geobacter sp. FeAm09]